MRRLFFRFALGAVLFLSVSAMAAADETFKVSAVHVDETGTSAVGARNSAITNGRVQAWQILFRRLSRQQDWPRQPRLDPDQLQKYITGYYPTAEKRSTTRYVADVTYIFNRDAVARLLQSAKIAYALTSAKRVLVIPMAPGYLRLSGWTIALANPRFSGGIVPFVVPIGDSQDMSVLTGLSFDGAKWSDIAPVAERRNASEAILIQATTNGEKMSLSLKRLGPNQSPTKASAETPLLQGLSSTYYAAAEVATRTLEDMWKNRTAVDFSRKGTLTADVRIVSLERFAAMQKQLAGVTNVADTGVLAMNTGTARLALTYQGSIEQLQESLSQAGFVLSRQGEDWQLLQGRAKAGAAP